jgi:hypothetical protein
MFKAAVVFLAGFAVSSALVTRRAQDDSVPQGQRFSVAGRFQAVDRPPNALGFGLAEVAWDVDVERVWLGRLGEFHYMRGKVGRFEARIAMGEEDFVCFINVHLRRGDPTHPVRVGEVPCYLRSTK